MRILLVEDDPALSGSLKQGLQQMGFAVELSSDGAEADAILALRSFDLVVLDLGLPGMSGMEVLRGLRKRGATTPVLILTAHDALQDKVAGLKAGADDYVLKPFDFEELEARLQALLRRTQSERTGYLEAGDLRLDKRSREALFRNQPLNLSSREVDVLEMLMNRYGRVVSKDQLAEHLTGLEEEIGQNAVEVYVHRLRKKLEPLGISVRTLRGLGYLLEKKNV
jgi:two-component system OmpR family response regulator